MVNYFYNEWKDILKKLIYHCHRKLIADLLSKLLLFDNYFIEKDSFDLLSSNTENIDNKKELLIIRNKVIEKIFLI